MGHATHRRLQRGCTLGAVLVLHGALIWTLLAAYPVGNPGRPAPSTVVVTLLPQQLPPPPRVRADHAPARPINGSAVRALPPMALGALPMGAAPASPAGGNGQGVDWAAEARRALRAYEIRSDRPPTNTSVSGESEDEWLRQLSHHPGDQVRTPTGDWIIWISADCYQVAKSGATMFAAGGPAPQAFCVDRSRPSAQ